MSHKSGHVIINAILPESGPAILPLSSDIENRLREIRSRDEYNITDRLYLGYVVGVIADDPTNA